MGGWLHLPDSVSPSVPEAPQDGREGKQGWRHSGHRMHRGDSACRDLWCRCLTPRKCTHYTHTHTPALSSYSSSSQPRGLASLTPSEWDPQGESPFGVKPEPVGLAHRGLPGWSDPAGHPRLPAQLSAPASPHPHPKCSRADSGQGTTQVPRASPLWSLFLEEFVIPSTPFSPTLALPTRAGSALCLSIAPCPLARWRLS